MIRQKLAHLARRVAVSHLMRFAAMLVLLLVPLQLAFFGLSFWPGLHTLGLRIGVTSFVAAAIGGAAWAARRWRRHRPGSQALAALYEGHYPELDERLLSVVELRESTRVHGAAEFVDHLARSAEQGAHALDPAAVYSLRGAWRMAGLAASLLLGVTVLFAASPRYERFCGRFFTAWWQPCAGYTIEVTPGDAWVERGKSATVRVRIVPIEADEPMPAEGFVVYEESGSIPQRVRMDRAEGDLFLFSWPSVREDVSYRVEVGGLATGPYRVEVVDPVRFERPTVCVSPPPYVKSGAIQDRPLEGAPLSFVQFSQVQFRWESLPEGRGQATLVVREASTGDKVAELAVQQLRIQFILFGVDIPTRKCGAFTATLVVDSGHGLLHTYAVPEWTIRSDVPPHFSTPLHVHGVRMEALQGGEQRVSPNELLRLRAVVEDAEGIADVTLEYRVNGGELVSAPIGRVNGEPRVEVDRVWSIPDGVSEGDRMQFRLRATDNRSLAKDALGPGAPSIGLTPQTSTSPAGEERWVELKIGGPADSLLKKEIAEQHDELRRLIDAVRQKLLQEHAVLGKLRQASHQLTALTATHVQQLSEAGRLNREAGAGLEQIANKLDDAGELGGLADLFRAIAGQELADAEQAIERFKGPRTAAEREKDAQAGKTAVLQALKKLDGLADLEKRLESGRLDRLEMDRLAAEQRELAQRALAIDPKDPKRAAELEKLRAEQERIAERLQQLAQKSELLRDAMAQMEAQAQARKLADQAGQLASDQHAAMKQETTGQDAALAKRVAELAKKQDDLAQRVHKQAEQSGQPMSFAEADQAAAALRQAAFDTAIERQTKTEADLAQWSAQVQKGGGPSSTSAIAKELAKKQGEIRADFQKLADDFANGQVNEQQLAAGVKGLIARQKTLTGQIGKLTVPAGDKKAEQLLAAARASSAEAADKLAGTDTLVAANKMDETKQTLEQLAGLLPKTPPNSPSPEEAKQREQQVKQIDSLTAEQKQLREESQRLAAEMAKSASQGGAEKRLAQMKQLAQDALKLSQQAAGPEAKSAAGKAAESAQQARKAMEAAMAEKGKGNASGAKAMEAEAALKLDVTKQNLEAAADKMQPSMNAGAKAAQETAQAKQQAQMAQQKLPAQPSQASKMMQQAAGSMQRASQQMGQQRTNSIPKTPNRPSVSGGGGSLGSGKGVPPALAKKLEPFAGRAWGELPGELKTELLQSVRAQFGDDYAPIIQQYFEQITRPEKSR